jgi:hypothetical protein
MDGEIFRGIRVPPVEEKDFLSSAEVDISNCKADDCEAWGLSVWISMVDVQHAQKIQRYTRKWHIARGKVTAQDGVILKTPSIPRPNHHTFWKHHGVELWKKFAIVAAPVTPGKT